MILEPETFHDDCYNAASEFLQTMIVVDDEARFGDDDAQPARQSTTPTRSDVALAAADETENGEKQTNPLNAQSLITAAMQKGIVCSVLRTTKDDDSDTATIAKTAEPADIICVDWEIDKDDGVKARNIIYDILKADAKQNGRMRLIAIYTARKDVEYILQKIIDEMSDELKVKKGLSIKDTAIVSQSGVRITYFRKDKGSKATASEPELVPVTKLPEKLIKEFAEISPGILSNIALATIASIRRSTHHTVMRYGPMMDGPYLAHRGAIGHPTDSLGYGVEITLSDLNTYIDRDEVESLFANKEAIERLTKSKDKGDGTTGTSLKSALNFIIGKDEKPNKKKLKKLWERTFLAADICANQIDKACDKFNYLTTISKHPGNIHNSNNVELCLGTIVKRNDGKFFLCVQPACDSVRVSERQSFAFLPLTECADDNEKPHYVAQIDKAGTQKRLKIESKAHTQMKSWFFEPDTKRKRVLAKYNKDQSEHVFFESNDEQSTSGETDNTGEASKAEQSREPYKLTWICQLKRSRALRDVQLHVANKLGRIGIDEFELHRQ